MEVQIMQCTDFKVFESLPLLVGCSTTVHLTVYIDPLAGIVRTHGSLCAMLAIFDYFVLLRTLSKHLVTSPFLIKQLRSIRTPANGSITIVPCMVPV
jgi:hypothetical protein